MVVGTVMCAINQGATLIACQATPGTWVRMVFNYIVPFLVASIGYLAARRTSRQDRRPTSIDP